MLVFKDIRDEEQLGKYLLENGLEPKTLRNSIFFGGFEDDKLFGICEAFQMTEFSSGIGMLMTHIRGKAWRRLYLGPCSTSLSLIK